MKKYSTYWRTTIFASIIFHFLAALGLTYVLPHLIPEPTIKDVAEIEWLDVDLLPPDVTVIEAEAIPTETVQEILPMFNAQKLFVPDLTIPEPVFVEETPPPEIKPNRLSRRNFKRRRKSFRTNNRLNRKPKPKHRPKMSSSCRQIPNNKSVSRPSPSPKSIPKRAAGSVTEAMFQSRRLSAKTAKFGRPKSCGLRDVTSSTKLLARRRRSGRSSPRLTKTASRWSATRL